MWLSPPGLPSHARESLLMVHREPRGAEDQIQGPKNKACVPILESITPAVDVDARKFSSPSSSPRKSL